MYDNVWINCMNCGHDFSIEELFSVDEDTETECPVCGSHILVQECENNLEENYY